MSIYERSAFQTVINACGTVTRLSGGRMHPEVAAAMVAASTECVDMVDLQAGACRVIARVTGREAGIVTSGASAGILLAAAACLAGLDPARMNRLPDVADGRNEFIVVRSQRNMYDRALAVAGGRIVEVGIPDRFSGPGVRDAAAWEIAAAITPNTAGIYYLAHPQSLPPLAEVAAVAHDQACRCWSMLRRSCRRSPTCGGSSNRAPIWSHSVAARRLAARNHPAYCAAGRSGLLRLAADA